ISGCMNSCGQHGMAHIGFHGSSLKAPDKRTLPALQVLLGGGSLGDGEGRQAEKVIKVPSKRGPEVLRYVFDDYSSNKLDGEYYNDYFDRKGKIYFYDLLKPLAVLEDLKPSDFIDWGHDVAFETAIGVGECASVIIDLIGTLLLESDEKIQWAQEAMAKNAYADAIYHAYSAQVNSAKALLLDKEINCSTQTKVIKEYTEKFDPQFEENVLQINKNEPTESFAKTYLDNAILFINKAAESRSISQAL
ncbi:MAG: nitrite reductase, partial [Leadbetterella sp.]